MHSLTLAPSARQDIAHHYVYPAEHAHSPEYPEVWLEGIEQAILGLSDFPLGFGLAPENAEFEEEIRHRIIGSYRLLFTVRDDGVHVLHVRHGRQDVLRADS